MTYKKPQFQKSQRTQIQKAQEYKKKKKDKNTRTHTHRNIIHELLKTKVRGTLENRQKQIQLYNTAYRETKNYNIFLSESQKGIE